MKRILALQRMKVTRPPIVAFSKILVAGTPATTVKEAAQPWALHCASQSKGET